MRKCIVCGKDMTGAYPTKQICSPECKKVRQAQLAPSHYEKRKKIRDSQKTKPGKRCTKCGIRPVAKGNYFFCTVCHKSIKNSKTRTDGDYGYDTSSLTSTERKGRGIKG